MAQHRDREAKVMAQQWGPGVVTEELRDQEEIHHESSEGGRQRGNQATV